MDAALAVGALALAKPGDVERLQRGLEGLPHGDVLEHLAGRHAVGQLGPAQHVDAAHLDRIAAEPAGDRLDRALHDPAHHAHGRPHRAVAALVGQHGLYVGGVVGDAVGAADDQGHHAGHVVRGIEAIGAEVLDDLQLEGEDAPLGVDGGARAHRVLARMAGCQQVLVAVLPPAHRALERARQRRHGQLLAVERDLLAEAAADVGRDDGHLRFAQAQPACELGAVGMRHLVADVHGEVAPPFVPLGAAAARLDRRVRLAVLVKLGLDDDRRLGEAPRRVAGREGLMRDQVGGERLVHQRVRRAPAPWSYR